MVCLWYMFSVIVICTKNAVFEYRGSSIFVVGRHKRGFAWDLVLTSFVIMNHPVGSCVAQWLGCWC